MIIFKLTVSASPAHPTYPPGVEIAAICMVDSADLDDARQWAADRLFELGWESITFDQSVLLPPDPDTSAFDVVMLGALGDAKELGVSLIVYPESSDTSKYLVGASASLRSG